MPRFRTTYRGRGKWRAIADWMNKVGSFCNNVRGLQGIDVQDNSLGGVDLTARAGSGRAGGIPPPPAEGIHMLVARDGVLAWEQVQEFTCPG